MEDVLLNGAPTGAPPFGRPIGNRPALLVQSALPGDNVVLGEMLPFDQLGADGLGQIRTKKRPHLVTEGKLFGGEA
jgi:hypothetical protein